MSECDFKSGDRVTTFAAFEHRICVLQYKGVRIFGTFYPTIWRAMDEKNGELLNVPELDIKHLPNKIDISQYSDEAF